MQDYTNVEGQDLDSSAKFPLEVCDVPLNVNSCAIQVRRLITSQQSAQW